MGLLTAVFGLPCSTPACWRHTLPPPILIRRGGMEREQASVKQGGMAVALRTTLTPSLLTFLLSELPAVPDVL